MQVLVALPDASEIAEGRGEGKTTLWRKACGIPLLARVVATACRSGGTELILLRPRSVPKEPLKTSLKPFLPSSLPVRSITLDQAFDPGHPADWRAVQNQLDSKFLWLPWNTVVEKKALSRLVSEGETSAEGVRFEWSETPGQEDRQRASSSLGATPEMPAIVVKEKLLASAESAEWTDPDGDALRRYLGDPSLRKVVLPAPPGVPAGTPETVLHAERELVRRSGKETDGIYSKMNRWLCRPAVRWLSKTPITPNLVTFGGLFVAIGSAYWFAQGYWGAYVLGALLYFVSVLFDEMDGMLARITFRDSAFGTWLETFVDYAGYILLFVGMTIGLYRESGALWLWLGGALLFGTLTAILVLSRQRKLATHPGAPHEYRQRLHRQLEADSGNILSRMVRQVEFLVRKPAYCYYLMIFTVLGGMKLFFLLGVLGSNVVWMMVLSFNRFFRVPSSGRQKLRLAGGT